MTPERYFKVEIRTDNAAFEPEWALRGEIARILRELAQRVYDQGAEHGFVLVDINGNSCGGAYLEKAEEEKKS